MKHVVNINEHKLRILDFDLNANQIKKIRIQTNYY